MLSPTPITKDQIPTLEQAKEHLVRTLRKDQMGAIVAWLSLESLQRESADVFMLSKDAVEMMERCGGEGK